ncbi:MAG: sigma 54-interacting transcriptional regulator [Byssovorax sp.]
MPPGPKHPPTRTEEHAIPSQPEGELVHPALVVAFPRSIAVPFPPSREPIGRDFLASVGLRDTEVSRAHAAFSRPGGVLHVEDAGSRNGTFLDGRRLAPGERAQAVDGAILRIGRTIFVIREALAGPFTASPPLGRLVGPFGLRAVEATLRALGARPPHNVLIEGETGTGKELVAEEIARVLGRRTPYTAVNVAGVASGVFESQLFGHVAGAFSGAGKGQRGVILAHDKGAVFLDEIGEIALDLQPKLLRLLDNREVLPVGAERPVRVDVLVIAATNRSLEAMVEAGTFRRDLLARLAAARVDLPPLRERAEDLMAIAQAMAEQRGGRYHEERVEIEAVERLLLHPFSSNVRELAAMLDRIAQHAPPPSLPLWAVERVLGAAPSARSGQLSDIAVRDALAAEGGNETRAAARLGVSRGKLRRFLAARNQPP